MWNTKCNYKRNESDTTCPLCKTEEDTTEHIMVCKEGNNEKKNNETDCEEIIAIYKNYKENREKLEQKSTKGKDIQQKVEII